MFSVTTVECAGPMRITLLLGRAICWRMSQNALSVIVPQCGADVRAVDGH